MLSQFFQCLSQVPNSHVKSFSLGLYGEASVFLILCSSQWIPGFTQHFTVNWPQTFGWIAAFTAFRALARREGTMKVFCLFFALNARNAFGYEIYKRESLGAYLGLSFQLQVSDS